MIVSSGRPFASFSRKSVDLLEPTIIRLVKDGCLEEALRSFRLMNSLNIKPTKFILCSILNCCSRAPDALLALQIHARIVRTGYEVNVFLGAKLLDIYGKIGAIGDARKLFDGMGEHDQVSWTSLISGFAHNGCGTEALLFFRRMLKTDSKPSAHTFASAISACKWSETACRGGSSFHAQVVKSGFGLNSFVISSLIDFYSKHGEIDLASSLFENHFEKDVILYNSMISGYSQNMLGEEALKLFLGMQDKDMVPTDFTLATILNSCGSMALLGLGRQIHSLIVKFGVDRNVVVEGALVDVYSKCGDIDEARRVFDYAADKNNIIWTSMITGYAQNGRGMDSLNLFEKLVEEGGRPDHICFTSVLTACNHAGFFDKGIYYFKLMTGKYGLVPGLDQYACMIDLYGRSGHVREAKELIQTIPLEPNAILWSSFLGSCRTYHEPKFAEEAAMKLFELEPSNAAPYITLSSTLAGGGMWNYVAEIRGTMQMKAVKMRTGWSWIEVDNMMHLFSVGDKSHPKSEEIFAELDKMNMQIREIL